MIEIITAIVSGVMTIVSGVLLYRVQNTDKKKKNGDKAMMILMRRELRLLHEKWMEKGYVTDTALGEFEEIYEIYHSLGGNGTGTVWKTDLENLERRRHE